MTPRPLLFISRDTTADWISAIEIGRVDDGVPADRWEPENCWWAWLLDEQGRKVGARLEDAAKAQLEDEGAFGALWDLSGPRFDAPTLGFVDVPMGAVLAGALERLQGQPSLGRYYFELARAADDHDEAMRLWSLCLEAGDLMAHYGLGQSHLAAGNHADAFHHLSYYSTLATHDPWTWCLLGCAAMAIGEKERALTALERAVSLEATTGDGIAITNAAELLAGLD